VKTDLGTVPGINPLDGGSTGWSINSKTQIVGISTTCDFSIVDAFLWEDGAPMIDLNTLIPPDSAMHLYFALNINDHGEIAGLGSLPNGDTHAFLLIPCGEGTEGCEDEAESATTAKRSNSTLTVAQGLALREMRGRFVTEHGVGLAFHSSDQNSNSPFIHQTKTVITVKILSRAFLRSRSVGVCVR
jgi:probable HAF family extracellular repeat protein